jgi:hypothetical protein
MPSSVIGAFDGDISFSTSDADENPFRFRVRARVGPAGQQLSVSGNSVDIANGDNTPSLSDHTDFGSAEQGATGVRRVFTVTNSGTTTVTLSGFTLTGGFSQAGGDRLTSTLPPSASDRFEVILPTTTAGVLNGTVTFTINDAATHTFSITGKVSGPDNGPEIAAVCPLGPRP